MSKIYRVAEFARRSGRGAGTVRRCEQEGRLIVERLPPWQRSFDETDGRAMWGVAAQKRLTVVYCRLESRGPHNDLASQVVAMEPYCLAGAIAVDEWIEEVGGGMNFKRKCLLDLVERIQRAEVKRVLIAYKDRLVRFGFDLLRASRGVKSLSSIRRPCRLSTKWWNTCWPSTIPSAVGSAA